MKRNDKKHKVEEPFPPERTPEPAQVINPSNRSPEGNKTQRNDRDEKKGEEQKPSDKKLGESPIEIDDETTI
jgi:hypothetical protein